MKRIVNDDNDESDAARGLCRFEWNPMPIIQTLGCENCAPTGRCQVMTRPKEKAHSLPVHPVEVASVHFEAERRDTAAAYGREV